MYPDQPLMLTCYPRVDIYVEGYAGGGDCPKAYRHEGHAALNSHLIADVTFSSRDAIYPIACSCYCINAECDVHAGQYER